MTIEGHVVNGQIVLNDPVPLVEGMRVRIELLAERDAVPANAATDDDQSPSLYERMKSFAGSVEGLPSDFAANHDHYLHGQPKRQ